MESNAPIPVAFEVVTLLLAFSHLLPHSNFKSLEYIPNPLERVILLAASSPQSRASSRLVGICSFVACQW